MLKLSRAWFAKIHGIFERMASKPKSLDEKFGMWSDDNGLFKLMSKQIRIKEIGFGNRQGIQVDRVFNCVL